MEDIEKLKKSLIGELQMAEKDIAYMKVIGGSTNKMVNDSYKVLFNFSKKQLITLIISYRVDIINNIIDKMEI